MPIGNGMGALCKFWFGPHVTEQASNFTEDDCVDGKVDIEHNMHLRSDFHHEKNSTHCAWNVEKFISNLSRYCPWNAIQSNAEM